MANISEVLAKATELSWQIDSLLRLSTYKQYDDLSGLNINYEDAEQLFLLDELRFVTDKLADVQDKISYMSRPIKETSRLHKNESGKYETQHGHYYSCGYYNKFSMDLPKDCTDYEFTAYTIRNPLEKIADTGDQFINSSSRFTITKNKI